MIGSLHVIVMIVQSTGPPQLSVPLTVSLTGVKRLLIGRRIDGVAVTLLIVGPSVSCTVILKLHAALELNASVTTQFTVVTPTGNAAPEGGLHAI
jgi:hypothetical protein